MTSPDFVIFCLPFLFADSENFICQRRQNFSALENRFEGDSPIVALQLFAVFLSSVFFHSENLIILKLQQFKISKILIA